EAALHGDGDAAIGYWRQAYQHDARCRKEIVKLLWRSASAEELLNAFDPDAAQCRELFWFYRGEKDNAGAHAVALRLAPALVAEAQGKPPSRAATLLVEAGRIYAYLDDPAQAVQCTKSAVELAPFEYSVRLAYAEQLLQADMPDDAVEQLEWCRRRRPDDPQLVRVSKLAAGRASAALRVSAVGQEDKPRQ
ncbi:MAG: hypothetical protein KDA41_11160, partial [Planctomycetales bacterium]|nr:hypothetical protein [Planctomycetales bacterium]